MRRTFLCTVGVAVLSLAWLTAVSVAPPSGQATQGGPISDLLPEVRDGVIALLDIPARADGAVSITVPLGASEYELELYPYSLRANDFELLVQGADGVLRSAPAPASVTVRGTVAGFPGSRVAGTLADGQLSVSMLLDEQNHWEIQPLLALAPGAPQAQGEHAIFRADDVYLDRVYDCLTLTPPDDERGNAGDGGGIASPGDKICDIACDADAEFYQRNGSSIPNTLHDIEDVMNRVETIYENDVDISYEVTTIVVWTSVGGDPYSSTDAGTLLNQFRNYWNSNFGDIRRDVAHLFTGKSLDGSTIGISWLSVICSSGYGYGLSESRFTSYMTHRACLTAHELGHAWSAGHCDGDTDCRIMCSGLGGCSGDCTRFGSRSIGDIVSFRSAISCLFTEPTWITPPFFDNFPSTTVDSAKWVYNDGATATANASNEPSSPYSLNLNASGGGAYQDDEIRTHFIRLDNAPQATVSYYTEHQGVEAGETLTVEYWSNELKWEVLETIVSDGSSQSSFEYHEHIVPDNALWEEFRLRFRADCSDVGDNWYIDDVLVTTGGVLVFDLAIESTPNVGFNITVTPPDYDGLSDGATNFARRYEQGTSVTLTAPWTSGDGVLGFKEWQLDAVPQAGDNTVTFDVLIDTTAKAVYATLLTLNIDSDGPTGVPVTVSPGDFRDRTDGTTSFVRKYTESTAVTLTAPASFGGYNFSYWEINGIGETPGQLSVVVNLDTLDEAALAIYTPGGSTETLTIDSTPLAGVNIQVSPLDNNGDGDGTTSFQRVYDSSELVTLTAPERPVVGLETLNFVRWLVDGVEQPEDQLAVDYTVSGSITLAADYVVLGDMDGDDQVNNADIPAFVLALTDRATYDATYGLDADKRGDFDDTGELNNGDIPGFVARLTGK